YALRALKRKISDAIEAGLVSIRRWRST
ncbi:MAG: hypothetical protein JWP07_730, partial [Pseudonocardiales bacterium]|nr:hypothetical protein [Pseudonocardiales bacterium]